MIETGRIIKCVGGLFTVLLYEGKTIDVRSRGILKKMRIPPVPGDIVTVDNEVIVDVKERKNVLIRPAVSNIDKLFIIIAFQKPDPDFLFIDKLTAIAEAKGIVPVLVFNKSDYEDIFGLKRAYVNVPYRRYIINAKDDIGIDELMGEIRGNICAMAGYSGVGKSSLMNRFFEKDNKKEMCVTGEISDKISRGKHTTTWSQLYQINGGFVVDTPGFNTIDFIYYDLIDKNKLIDYFPDLKEQTGGCRFSDCIHINEKDCSVKDAVEKGLVSSSRYGSYKSLYDSLKDISYEEQKMILQQMNKK